MLKKIPILLSAIFIVSFLNTSIFAGTSMPHQSQAESLKGLGLFSGGSDGFELDRQPTRIEAAVMLVRLLGKEKEAINGKWVQPFNDVPKWADKYIGFLYANGLAKGSTPTRFGASDKCSASMYVTFVLRALGYNDTKGDFSYADSLNFAIKAQLINEDEYKALLNPTFLRDDMVGISYNALKTEMKKSADTLAAKLLNEGAITQAAAEKTKIANKPEIAVNNINTEGSVRGNSNFAEQDGWIYFANPGDDDSLYKMKNDGTMVTKLSRNRTEDINVMGKYVFYHRYQTVNDSPVNHIMRINIDGTDEKVFIEHKAYIEMVKDGWLYYIDKEEGHKHYRIRIDGTDKSLSDYTGTYQDIYVTDKSTYYIKDIDYNTPDGIYGDNAIFRADLGGGNEKQIYFGQYRSLLEYGTKLFIGTVKSPLTDYKFISMNLDGTGTTVISDGVIKTIIANKNYIYYGIEDEKFLSTVYRIRPDGSDKQAIAYDVAEFDVLGDWIYYWGPPDPSLIKLKTDGSTKYKLSGIEWKLLN